MAVTISGNGVITGLTTLPDSAITSSSLADGAVTSAKIASGGIYANNLSSQSISANSIGAVIEHHANVSSSMTIETNNNAVSGGPITINTGVSVTVANGSIWTIV